MTDHRTMVAVERELRDSFEAEGHNVFQMKGDWFVSFADLDGANAGEWVNLTRLADRIVHTVAGLAP